MADNTEAVNEDTLEQTIYNNLISDIGVAEDLKPALLIKVQNAIKEVTRARRYPSDMEQEAIDTDLQKFYTNIYDLAMYDFNIRGAEGQTTINENGEYRSFVERKKLLNGVTPIAIIA